MSDEQSQASTVPSRLDSLQRGVIDLWAFLLVLAVYPVEEPATQAKHLVSGICVAVLALLGVVSAFKGGHAKRPLAPGLQILLGLLLAYLVAALFSAERLASLYALYPWICFAIFGFAAARLYTDPRHAERLLIVIACAVGLSAVYGICQRFGLDPFPWAEVDRLEYTASPSTYGNPNFAGHALIIGLVIAAGLAAKARAWLAVPAVLMLVHLGLTGMRSAYLALAAAVVVFVAFYAIHRVFKRPLCSMLLVVILLGSLAGWGALRFAPSISEEGPVPFDSSIISRLNSYYAASKMFLDAPYLGAGPGGYARQIAEFQTPFQRDWFAMYNQRGAHVHAEPLEAAVEAGAAGAFFFLAFLLWPVIQGLRMAVGPPDRRVLGGIVACVFIAAGVDSFFGFNMHVPVSAGLLFLLFGVTEGLRAPANPGGGSRLFSPLLACLLALGCAATAVVSFSAARHAQYAQGAVAYAREKFAEGNPDAAKPALDAAQGSLAFAGRMLPWQRRFPERLVEVSLMQGAFDAAVIHAEDAIARAPHAPELRVSAARVYINRAGASGAGRESIEPDLEAATKHLETAKGLNPGVATTYETMARLALLRAESADSKVQAESYRRRAVQLAYQAIGGGFHDPPSAYRLIAATEVALGNAEEAAQALTLAAEAAPAFEDTWALFEQQAAASGNATAYVAALNTALRGALSPVPLGYAPDLAARLGRAFPTVPGNPEGAPESVKTALGLAPARLDLWGAAAQCYPVEARLEKLVALLSGITVDTPVRKLLEDASVADTQEVAYRQMVGIVRSLPEDTPPETANNALGWVAEVLAAELDPSLDDVVRGRVLMGVGETYLACGRYDAAREALESAVPLLSGTERAEAELYLSRTLAGLGDFAAALQYARSAAASATNPLWPRWNLAKRLAENDLNKEARLLYEQLLVTPGIGQAQRDQIQTEIDAMEEAQ